jgi:phenylacetate-CoA ligase
MNDRNLARYFDEMRRFRPEFLHGYPSAISLVAEFVHRHPEALAGIQLKAILLGSEALFPDQRERIEGALKARIYSWYGHSERLILAGECETSTAYHHFPDYGVAEILKEDGTVASQPGERGELVGTGVLNRSLPMIRYRTGDRARLLEPHCSCGRSFDRFDEVEGRWDQEYVLGNSGARISTAALNMHGPFFDRVKRYQYAQEVKGSMEIRVLPADDFTEADALSIRQAYEKKCGTELQIAVTVVDEIPLTPRGKVRRLIQKLPGV